MKKTISSIMLVALLALGTTFLSACGGGGGSSKPPVGPKIKGKWTGVYYIDGVANSSEDITAKVKQNGDAVVINTSRPDDMEGGKLTGTIDEGGEIFASDNFDGETWTTRFGPATESSLTMSDFRRDISDTAIAIIQLSR